MYTSEIPSKHLQDCHLQPYHYLSIPFSASVFVPDTLDRKVIAKQNPSKFMPGHRLCYFCSYFSFSRHYQGSIDFNTVNIKRTIGMYFLVFTGNRVDIERYDLQRSYHSILQRVKLNTGGVWGLKCLRPLIPPILAVTCKAQVNWTKILIWERIYITTTIILFIKIIVISIIFPIFIIIGIAVQVKTATNKRFVKIIKRCQVIWVESLLLFTQRIFLIWMMKLSFSRLSESLKHFSLPNANLCWLDSWQFEEQISVSIIEENVPEGDTCQTMSFMFLWSEQGISSSIRETVMPIFIGSFMKTMLTWKYH